jgi:hypothetical protein
VLHGPVAGQSGNPAHEVTDQCGPAWGVHHLGVELHSVELAGVVGDGGKGRAGRDADDLEAGGKARDPVAVAHPYGVAVALFPHTGKQRAVVLDLEFGAAEFAVVAGFDRAAELRHHGLLAIADAEHGELRLEHPVGRARGAHLGHAGGAAGKDHGFRLQPLQCAGRVVERYDLGIDPVLAHPAGDQLSDLAAEVDDEDGVWGCARLCLGHGQRTIGLWSAVQRPGRENC